MSRKQRSSKADETPEFQMFWEIWRPYARHTDGRGLARETFTKLVNNGADPQDIVDGARFFFRSMKDRDKEFVPLSSTWMHRGSFEDMADQERQYQERQAQREQVRSHPSSVVVSLPSNHFMNKFRSAS